MHSAGPKGIWKYGPTRKFSRRFTVFSYSKSDSGGSREKIPKDTKIGGAIGEGRKGITFHGFLSLAIVCAVYKYRPT
jgi:hypothetical protein